MIQKVRVITTTGPDLKGEGILADIKNLGIESVKKVTAVKVYRLEGISLTETKILAEKLLSESINQKYTINCPIHLVHFPGVTIIEIAYKPGVMNPEVTSIMKAASDLGIGLLACDTSFEYVFFGNLTKSEIVEIIERLKLFNPLVEQIVTEELQTLITYGQPGQTKTIPIRDLSDESLMGLSKDKLFLNLEEMKTIQKYFKRIKRDPTDLELETLGQTWSEHSGHKTFKSEIVVDGKKKQPFIKRLKKEALKHDKNIVSAFADNAGVMDFYEGFGICGKVETHNAPSVIEPYGGAMTGSGGVFRDIAATGKGAKNIASTDIFCLAPVNLPTLPFPAGCLPPQYLLKRVVAGVRDYGNRMGIPTNNGSVHFHQDFRARPIVLVGAYGIVPKKYAIKDKPYAGDLIVCVGGRTGRDGIHGATFSSGEMTEKTMEVNSSAVQIGNAIEEKRMFDCLLEARDQDLITLVQDCGGGGFSSAIGEIGEETGVLVDIKKAPLKYQGLAPWEIWLSESQERMIAVVQKKNLKKFKSVCNKYNAEMVVLGKFDASKRLKVYWGKEKVGDLDMQFLHHGLPRRVLYARRSSSSTDPELVEGESRSSRLIARTIKLPKTEKEWIKIVKEVLSHGNVCSKEPIVRLYDHSVQGTNDLQPYSGVNLDGPNDSPVLRPFLDKNYGVIISHGLNPILNSIDPYWGSIWAGAEALANFAAVGGDYKNASLINNYIWPFPDEESLWSLDASVDAVVDFMKVFKIPVISGKDSLSSTYRLSNGTIIKIPPTLCMSVFGKIKDVSKTVTADFKKAGSTIVLVGKMDIGGMGGSTYFDICHSVPFGSELRAELLDTGSINNIGIDSRPSVLSSGSKDFRGNDIVSVPQVDLTVLPKTFDAIYKGIQRGKILSCHDVSEGGIIAAVFEMCVGGGMGAAIHLGLDTSDGDRLKRSGSHGSSEVDVRPDYFLFNETAGCFIVEVENESVARQLFRNVPYRILGKTEGSPVIGVKGLFRVNVLDLKKVWQEPMKRLFA